MRRAALVLLAALLASPVLAQTPVAATPPAAETAAAYDAAIKAALAAPDRSLDARLRDEGRKVDLILRAANAKPGDRVLDVGAGGGYLALLFSSLVGETGHVDIHNTPGWINQFPGMEPDAQRVRIERANIGYVTARWDRLPGEPASYDIIVMGQVYHDAVLEGANMEVMDARLYALLKPGGRVVIEDHDADAKMHIVQQANLHRISHDNTESLMRRAGFIPGSLLLLNSEHDDMRFNVFRPGVRGRTDRFIAVFVKPGG